MPSDTQEAPTRISPYLSRKRTNVRPPPAPPKHTLEPPKQSPSLNDPEYVFRGGSLAHQVLQPRADGRSDWTLGNWERGFASAGTPLCTAQVRRPLEMKGTFSHTPFHTVKSERHPSGHPHLQWRAICNEHRETGNLCKFGQACVGWVLVVTALRIDSMYIHISFSEQAYDACVCEYKYKYK